MFHFPFNFKQICYMHNGSVITSIELYKLFIPLKEPFVISLGPIHSVQNVLVIIRTADGCAGYGECSPYMSINGESVDTCFIVGQYFAKALKGQNALDLVANIHIMDKIIWANSSIKSAFDMALHDVAAQHAGLPLYQFLGGDKTKTLYTDMTVSIGTPEKMAADALRFKEQGFTVIKVKLGEHPERDLERIKAIRDAVGMDIPIRVDANQGWATTEVAIQMVQALSAYNIQHCEEPIARWKFMELPLISDGSPIPIMADESCCEPHDAERLIGLNACHMLNIKLGKSGGIYKAVQIVEMAAQAELPMQIGGFMESRLGMTASAHLALINPFIHHCDFDTPLMFTQDPVIGGITYGEKYVVEVPDAPGLGAVIDERFLEKAEKVVV